MFSFKLPIKAVPKQRPRGRVLYKGRKAFCSMYTPEETRKFEDYVAKESKQYFKTPLNSLLRVELRFFFTPANSESKKKKEALYGSYYEKHKDCDNLAKSVCDGLNKVAYDDDSQIVELFVSKKYAREDYIEVEITEV